MPRPNARKKAIRKIPRNSRGQLMKKVPESEQDIPVDQEDCELLDLTEEMIVNTCQSQQLRWQNGADNKLRGSYQKYSETTLWRKREREGRFIETAVKKSHKLTDYGFIIERQLHSNDSTSSALDESNNDEYK
ncbi:hypothetical protein DFQ28_009868 [Apophysomyces sp. BC1034]|nr:hypothetical protein DFQ30_009660 [Apophysomyces sp. BC1015]KAG0172010.1 hypothetical protein DFQ29_008559 [Apophysomyces sp. BC1021]KAG0185146.1 hypothetical protein DFQ28_009868 [Apophysomyces sp. BC1034]